MGKPWAGHCGCPSAEQIVQTVHSPSPILSPVHCLCPCISFWLGKIALRASEQTVQKRASYLLPFPGELAFLFQLQAVKGLESLCQDPELIALSLGADAGVFITKCSVKCFLANYAASPPQPSPLTVAKHLVFDTYRMSFCNTNDVFSCCDSTMVWIVMGYSAAVKDLVEWRQTANFCERVFCLPCSMTVGTRAKLGNKMSKLTDASINRSCCDIWWPEL